MSKTGTCKHFNGTWHNTHCEAGVCYRDVTTDPDRLQGSALRIPCHSPDSDARQNLTQDQEDEFHLRGKCDKYEEPTEEEVAAEKDAIAAIIDRMRKVGPLIGRIKKAHAGEDVSLVETCPACGGKLHLSHAACNGHVWGKCETEGCLAWME